MIARLQDAYLELLWCFWRKRYWSEMLRWGYQARLGR